MKIQQIPLLKKEPAYPLNTVSTINGRDIAKEVWGSLPYDTLFVYLYRRFGPPMWPSDDYKDLCCYFLTTKDADVFVMIRLASYGFLYISPFVTDVIRMRCMEEHFLMTSYEKNACKNEFLYPESYRVYMVYRNFLNQMLSPVGIRDTRLNCLGAYTKNGKEVSAFQYAGYPVVPAKSDPKLKIHLSHEAIR